MPFFLQNEGLPFMTSPISAEKWFRGPLRSYAQNRKYNFLPFCALFPSQNIQIENFGGYFLRIFGKEN